MLLFDIIEQMNTNQNIAVCLQCGQILHSKHRHDFVQCDCPNHTFTDGGNDYKRRGGMDLRLIKDCKTIKEATKESKKVKDKQ